MGKIECEVRGHKKYVYDDEQCLYQQNRVPVPEKACVRCSRYKSVQAKLAKVVKIHPTINRNLLKKISIRALFRDSPSWFDNSVTSDLKALQKQYEEKQDPIPLMLAFTEAIKYKQPIPTWVSERIDKVFRKYLYSDEYKHEADRSLDKLMGCEGAGKDRPRERLAIKRRNLRLMTDMGRLRQQGMKIADAAEVVSQFNPKGKDKYLSADEIRQMYYDLGKKWRIKEIQKYDNIRRTKALLKFAPKALKEKYLNIKILQKKYPGLFAEIN